MFKKINEIHKDLHENGLITMVKEQGDCIKRLEDYHKQNESPKGKKKILGMTGEFRDAFWKNMIRFMNIIMYAIAVLVIYYLSQLDFDKGSELLKLLFK